MIKVYATATVGFFLTIEYSKLFNFNRPPKIVPATALIGIYYIYIMYN